MHIFDSNWRSKALRYWAVPTFLVFIAAIHMYRTHVFQQSSWGAGCGFGMFTTVDYHDSRFFRCAISIDGNTQMDAFFGPSFRKLNLQARVTPSDYNLSKLANELTRAEWYEVVVFDPKDESNVLARIADTDSQAQEFLQRKFNDRIVNTRSTRIRVESLEIELLGIRFDTERQQIKSHLINKLRLQRKTPNSDVASWNKVYR